MEPNSEEDTGPVWGEWGTSQRRKESATPKNAGGTAQVRGGEPAGLQTPVAGRAWQGTAGKAISNL